jgi:hypothetical protein
MVVLNMLLIRLKAQVQDQRSSYLAVPPGAQEEMEIDQK